MHTTSALQGEDQQQRSARFCDWYDDWTASEGREPTIITVHQVFDEFGAPKRAGGGFKEAAQSKTSASSRARKPSRSYSGSTTSTKPKTTRKKTTTSA